MTAYLSSLGVAESGNLPRASLDLTGAWTVRTQLSMSCTIFLHLHGWGVYVPSPSSDAEVLIPSASDCDLVWE